MSIELPSKKEEKPKEEPKVNIDEDIELAKKLQEELYAEHDKKFEIPRYQPPQYHAPRRDMDIEYEPGDFYDMTKQYNIENNLPEDPPLRVSPR